MSIIATGGGRQKMTREDIYRIALLMTHEEREAFMVFLSALLENEDTVPLPEAVPQGFA